MIDNESEAVSVIIPTLNEAEHLGKTIESLRRYGACEIIVVDGGSTDETLEIARTADVRMTAPRGRASQMNAGASQAKGTYLLFLHADCQIECGALEEVRRICAATNVAAGCFRMRIQATGPLYRCIEWSATWRTRLTGLIYGDQGMFLRRSVFDSVGGFPPVALMEDLCLSRRLKRLGRILVADSSIYVSARRWQRCGIVRQTLRNWTLTALAGLGVHPNRLARFYPTVR